MPKYFTTDKKMNLAVVGLGPAGLAAVLHAAASGKSVVGFGNRSEYVRGQRIVLNFEVIAFLKKYIDRSNSKDLVFADELNVGTVQIKDVERFLYRKIEQFPKASLVILKKEDNSQLGCSNNEHYMHVKTIEDEKNYYFQHLLATDGVKHHTADEVSRIFNKTITYSKSAYQLRHSYHGAVQLKVAKGFEPPTQPMMAIQAQQQIKSGLQCMMYGWDMKTVNDMPKCYIIPNAAHTKFSFAGEIPASIYKETNETLRSEKLKQWACLAILKEYGIPAEQLEFKVSRKNSESHEHLKATAFMMEMNVCNEPFVYLHDNDAQGVFAQVGDARRVPNYRLGRGANDAIECAIKFVDCIDNDTHSFDTGRYSSFISSVDRQIDSMMSDEVARGERSIKFAKNKMGKAIKDLIPLLKLHQIDTSIFNAVKEGGFSLSNLINVMNHIDSQMNTRTEEVQNVLNERINILKEAIVSYSDATSDAIKMINSSDTENDFQPSSPPSI